MITLKRVYEEAAPDDGARFLVERLWPRGIKKAAERERRSERMKGLVKKGKLPFTPVVMSWLSAELDKPSNRITQADVDRVLANK